MRQPGMHPQQVETPIVYLNWNSNKAISDLNTIIEGKELVMSTIKLCEAIQRPRQ